MFYETLETRSMFSVALNADSLMSDAGHGAAQISSVAQPLNHRQRENALREDALPAETALRSSVAPTHRERANSFSEASQPAATAERSSGSVTGRVDRVFSTRLINNVPPPTAD